MSTTAPGSGAELANKIARLVEERGWNQEDFARISKLNRHTIRQILQGGPKRRLRNAQAPAYFLFGREHALVQHGGDHARQARLGGRVAPGLRADLTLLDAPDWRYLAYHLAGDVVAGVVRGGRYAGGNAHA